MTSLWVDHNYWLRWVSSPRRTSSVDSWLIAQKEGERPIRVFISVGWGWNGCHLKKMKAYAATFCASSLSGLVLLGCFLAMWVWLLLLWKYVFVYRYNIHNDINGIYDELEEEMTGFKQTTDDLWRDMLRIGSKTQVSFWNGVSFQKKLGSKTVN